MNLARSMDAEVIGGVLGHDKGYSMRDLKLIRNGHILITRAHVRGHHLFHRIIDHALKELITTNAKHRRIIYDEKGIQNQDKIVNTTGVSRKNKEERIFSHQEYLNRKAKGLWFKCGEPFNPHTHVRQ